MKKVVHKADSRGHVHFGWLQSSHSFSFGNYFNPERMNFGALKVLNDDRVNPGQGFDTHPHQDMEIISIPLSGALAHKDSTGQEKTIIHGEVQLMSAGSGVYHSEFNPSDQDPVHFLQIWIQPEKMGIAPRYDQASFAKEERQGRIQTVVSPLGSDYPGVKINQQAYLSLLDMVSGASLSYKSHKEDNGVYAFVLSGLVQIANEALGARDAIGVSESAMIEVQAEVDTSLLFIEVPMT